MAPGSLLQRTGHGSRQLVDSLSEGDWLQDHTAWIHTSAVHRAHGCCWVISRPATSHGSFARHWTDARPWPECQLPGEDGLQTQPNCHRLRVMQATCLWQVHGQDLAKMPRSIDMRSSEDCTDIQFSENDILNILNRLKTDKSPGPDELLPRLLSEVKKKK